jgi:hypothetical protein
MRARRKLTRLRGPHGPQGLHGPLPRLVPLLALLPLLLAPDCDGQEDPIGTVEPVDFEAELYDPGPSQQQSRSQPAGVYTADNGPSVFVEMTAPVTVSSTVVDHGAGDSVPERVCVFLDGAGPFGDVGGEIDSLGGFVQTVLPSTYLVTVAPDCLTGTRPARHIHDVVLERDTPEGAPLDWSLPERGLVEGDVRDSLGDAVAGAVVTVYPNESPGRPLGVTTLTDDDGSFGFSLPEGVYTLVVASPADGSVPIAPVRVVNQALPFPVPGFRLAVEVPRLPLVPLSGRLLQPGVGNTPIQGRIRIEGWVPPEFPGDPFPGGLFRAEFETGADGEWAISVPRAPLYSVRALPRLAQSEFAPAQATLAADPAAPPPELELRLQDARLAHVTVTLPGGSPQDEAGIVLRKKASPHWSYRVLTGESGTWAGLLPGDLYELEVQPPRDEATGDERYAHGWGSIDLRLLDAAAALELPRSRIFEGFVYTEGQAGVADVRVLVGDPETGKTWDDSVTRSDEYAGYFRANIPR